MVLSLYRQQGDNNMNIQDHKAKINSLFTYFREQGHSREASIRYMVVSLANDCVHFTAAEIREVLK
jgi:hypothetical protein